MHNDGGKQRNGAEFNPAALHNRMCCGYGIPVAFVLAIGKMNSASTINIKGKDTKLVVAQTVQNLR